MRCSKTFTFVLVNLSCVKITMYLNNITSIYKIQNNINDLKFHIKIEE